MGHYVEVEKGTKMYAEGRGGRTHRQQASRRLTGRVFLPAQLSRVLGCHGFCVSNNRATENGNILLPQDTVPGLS